MTQYAQGDHALPMHPRSAARGPSAAGTAFFGGALAAGLGLGAFATMVLALWIVSPYPDSGPAGALHIATDLWLLAHGADLVRTETTSGAPAPMGLTPLLFTVLPCLLLYRAARQTPLVTPMPDEATATDEGEEAGEDGESGSTAGSAADEEAELVALGLSVLGITEDPPVPPLPPRTAFTALLGGYLLVSVAAMLYASSGPLSVEPLSALLNLPLVAAAACGAGVWVAAGCPGRPVPSALRWIPVRLRAWFTRPRLVAVARAGTFGTVVLLAGGALLLTISLGLHAGAAQETVTQLAAGWSGRVAVVLLSVALLPNAVIWAAAYGLGPGFTVGAGSAVAPLALHRLGTVTRPGLPRFPLLAALPAEGPAGPLVLAGGAALALAVGVAIAWAAVPRRPVEAGRREVTAIAFLAALFCAALAALLAYASAGPLGRGTLSGFGPHFLYMGAAVFAWSFIGVPGALIVRWRRRAVPRPQEQPEQPELSVAREPEPEPQREPVPAERARRSWWRRTGIALGLDLALEVPRRAARGSWWRLLAGWLGFATGAATETGGATVVEGASGDTAASGAGAATAGAAGPAAPATATGSAPVTPESEEPRQLAEDFPATEPDLECAGAERPEPECLDSEPLDWERRGSEQLDQESRGSERPSPECPGSERPDLERSESLDSEYQGSEPLDSEDWGPERLEWEGRDPERLDPGRRGSEQLDSEDRGSERSGWERQGFERLGPEHRGSERLGPESLGAEGLSWARPGSEPLDSEDWGPERPDGERGGPERPDSECRGSERPGSEHWGSERPDWDGRGSGRSGRERRGSERPDPEPLGSERLDSECRGSEWSDSESRRSGRPDPEPLGSQRPDPKRRGSGHPDPQAPESEQPDPKGSESQRPESKGAEAQRPEPEDSEPELAESKGPGPESVEPERPEPELGVPETLPVQPVGGVVLGADGQAAPPRRRRRRWWQRSRAAGKARHAARKADGRAARRARHAAAPPAPAEEPERSEWHDSGARQVRWAALKDSGGGLMPDFEPGEFESSEPRASAEER
ncbi:DUF6350 family protein [Streptomyces sp. NPDC052396]|uniref:cell division protein PerM n=1 Tax=Streptomyces sp. NPDC052396 TaxID=3365689 RepID=UPI0037D37C45